uniref:Uncharacterized protein n=1 Tax=Anopheles farauti TaxID=69004 RepID=A0A182QCS1_9DIPT
MKKTLARHDLDYVAQHPAAPIATPSTGRAPPPPTPLLPSPLASLLLLLLLLLLLPKGLWAADDDSNADNAPNGAPPPPPPFFTTSLMVLRLHRAHVIVVLRLEEVTRVQVGQLVFARKVAGGEVPAHRATLGRDARFAGEVQLLQMLEHEQHETMQPSASGRNRAQILDQRLTPIDIVAGNVPNRPVYELLVARIVTRRHVRIGHDQRVQRAFVHVPCDDGRVTDLSRRQPIATLRLAATFKRNTCPTVGRLVDHIRNHLKGSERTLSVQRRHIVIVLGLVEVTGHQLAQPVLLHKRPMVVVHAMVSASIRYTRCLRVVNLASRLLVHQKYVTMQTRTVRWAGTRERVHMIAIFHLRPGDVSYQPVTDFTKLWLLAVRCVRIHHKQRVVRVRFGRPLDARLILNLRRPQLVPALDAHTARIGNLFGQSHNSGEQFGVQ